VLEFVVLGEHLGGVERDLAAEVRLHVGVARRLSRVADVRTRENVLDEVVVVVFVSPSVCEVAIWF
jgi:hypothetical protein